ncbi:MAG: type II toxin-antitoxin system VapC family toxin [Bifidobacteriaceae bacterium]|nr:type II toxin-antitoxin system VapC family toxin [Bifidobacteriaceae bacterium]
MIIVDTSVWIDHLHQANPELQAALESNQVVAHAMVIEELAAGSLKSRGQVVAALAKLPACQVLTHAEYLQFVASERLWGKGLGPTDIHLLGSARITGHSLWTRDKRLTAAAQELAAGPAGQFARRQGAQGPALGAAGQGV